MFGLGLDSVLGLALAGFGFVLGVCVRAMLKFNFRD